MRRAAIAALLATASSLAFADRLITTPTATRVRDGVWRIEGLSLPSQDTRWAWLETGLGHSFDIGLQVGSWNGGKTRTTFDFSYNLTLPVSDIAPGISFGIKDGFNQTPEGRGLFLAGTWRIGNFDPANQDVPTEFTVGFWSRRTGLMFLSASFPFSKDLRLIMEHDSARLWAGAEWKPFREASLRALFRDGQPGFSFSLQKRF